MPLRSAGIPATVAPLRPRLTDVPGHRQRRFKRSSCSSTVSVGRSPDYRPRWAWAILSAAGARQDDFPSDRTTSATSLTSNGDVISVSFDLVEPPGISVLAVDPPRGPGRSASSGRPDVIAAHRDVVLFKVSAMAAMLSPFSAADALVDYFVYRANSDPALPLPSLSLLPVHYHEEKSFGGRPMQLLLIKNHTGIMSCRSKEGSSFVVADLSMTRVAVGAKPVVDAHLFWSGSAEWKLFKNLHVHGANGGRDLRWWRADAVVPDYRSRCLIWVDYYRGMILMDMLPESEEKNPPPPRLRYVPLPVVRISGDPEDIEAGRGCREGSRTVCATRHGIKFVSVYRLYCSNFSVGHAGLLTWDRTFRITTWSLREDDYTWRKDVTMYEKEFRAALCSGNHFPHVPPEYPVVDMENPDAVCFRLKKKLYKYEEPKWMIEIDMKRKVLLAAIAYTKKTSSSGDEDPINSARIYSNDLSFSTELPRYLDDGQACKKRRQ